MKKLLQQACLQLGWYVRMSYITFITVMTLAPFGLYFVPNNTLQTWWQTTTDLPFSLELCWGATNFFLILSLRLSTILKPTTPLLSSFNSIKQQANSHYFNSKRDNNNVRIHFQTLGDGPLIILCGNGLGCGLQFSVPILNAIEDVGLLSIVTLVTWDYRGLFKSTEGTENNKLETAFFSVRDSAMDAAELLNHLKCEQCFAYFGWSTGVQVGLELAGLFPNRINKLVLLNGAHGHILHSLLQPFFRLPFLGDLLHLVLFALRRSFAFYQLAKWFTLSAIKVVSLLVLRPICFISGRSYYNVYAVNYFTDFFAYGQDHSAHYLKYPHSLDAHSAFHLLPEIQVSERASLDEDEDENTSHY